MKDCLPIGTYELEFTASLVKVEIKKFGRL